jgi:Catalase
MRRRRVSLLGGWFSPDELTPARLVDGFQEVFGIHSGFRRNHAKGMCVTGYFESNGAGARLSKAAVFKSGRVPEVGRLSLPGGNPYVSDTPASVRGMGLDFTPANGEEWRTAMVDIPVFAVRTAQGFYDQLLAGKPDPATGKPDPEKLKTFFDGHPESARALTIIKAKPFSSGFDNATFNGLNAFRFINATGTSTVARRLRLDLVSSRGFIARPCNGKCQHARTGCVRGRDLEDYPALNRDLLSTRQSLRPGTSAQMTSPLHVRHREPWRKAILREFAR